MKRSYTQSQCMDWLHARVREEHGCLIWTHHVDKDGMPRATVDSQYGRAVRRWVYACHHPDIELGKRVVGVTCKEPLCLNPAHLVVRTKRAACQLASANGSYRDPMVIAKRAESLRKASTFSLEKARELRRRVHEGERLPVLAVEMGLGVRHAQAIVSGRYWAESVLPNSVFSWRAAA